MRKAYDAPWFRSRDSAIMAAAACWLAGAVILWDAFERRGNAKPTWLRAATNLPSVF